MQNSSLSCEYVGICGGCSMGLLDMKSQLQLKTDDIKQKFACFNIEKFEIFSSTNLAYRSRAEFRIFHKDSKIYYAMSDKNKKLFTINNCAIVDKNIAKTMQKLLLKLQENEILSKKLFAVEFLNSTQNDIIVTLIYHKKLDDIWSEKAKEIENILHIKLIGRSKKQKIVVSTDIITNIIKINDTKYLYEYKDTTFVQPNHEINQKMINFINQHIKTGGDMCELYCGAGNFTIPLSAKFDKLLATEINKTSIKLSKQNAKINKIENIKFARLSSSEFAQAKNKLREFRRLKELDIDLLEYNFSTILVDPPRAGLDEQTLFLLKEFEQIVYISCNPDTLKENLKTILKTHKIKKFAFFDQFVWTKHIEIIVILESI